MAMEQRAQKKRGEDVQIKNKTYSLVRPNGQRKSEATHSRSKDNSCSGRNFEYTDPRCVDVLLRSRTSGILRNL